VMMPVPDAHAQALKCKSPKRAGFGRGIVIINLPLPNARHFVNTG
jgi:hypothetical protein